jgi:hypothetical protein
MMFDDHGGSMNKAKVNQNDNNIDKSNEDKKINPFDIVNSITFNKQNVLSTPELEKQYNAFIVNRALSYFRDTALLANEMNRLHHIDYRMQYDFLLNTIRKGKRFSKWHKKDKSEDMTAIKEYYGYGNIKAATALNLLSEEQIEHIKSKLSKGG